MTKLFTILIFILIQGNLFGQLDYSAVDNASKNTPSSLRTIAEISKHLTKDLGSDELKVRALYVWVTHNIQYDMGQIKNPITYTDQINIADEALKKRKGVCEHYAQLFHQMCSAVGITSYVIPGYTRQSASADIDMLNHAWNGVVIDNTYYLLDPTWDAGYFTKEGYVHEFRDDFFLAEPKKFLNTHMPFDPIWQFLNPPITHTAYKIKDFTKLEARGDFAFRDSIALLKSMDTVAILENSIERTRRFGISNALISEEIAQNERLISYYRYNDWVARFNGINKELKLAVDEINRAVSFHNAYFKKLNKKQGMSQADKEALTSSFVNAEKHLFKGQNLLSKAESKIVSLEYTGKNSDHMQHSKTNKKNLLEYVAQLNGSNVKLKTSLTNSRGYYKKRLQN